MFHFSLNSVSLYSWLNQHHCTNVELRVAGTAGLPWWAWPPWSSWARPSEPPSRHRCPRTRSTPPRCLQVGEEDREQELCSQATSSVAEKVSVNNLLHPGVGLNKVLSYYLIIIIISLTCRIIQRCNTTVDMYIIYITLFYCYEYIITIRLLYIIIVVSIVVIIVLALAAVVF